MAGSTQNLARLKSMARSISTTGWVAVGLGTLAIVALAASFFAFSRGVIISSTPPGGGLRIPKEAEYQAEFEKYLAQYNGRSLFIVPGRTVAEAPPAPAVVDDGPKVEDKPTSYAGPDIIAMVMDTVWFSDGKKLRVGDPAQDQLEVVEIKAPWEAVVNWKGAKFTVPLFPRDQVVLKDPPKADSTAAKPDKSSATQAEKPEFVGPPVPPPEPAPNPLAVTPAKPQEPGATPGNSDGGGGGATAPAAAPVPPAEAPTQDPDGGQQ
jgi:hypothetical protein